MKLNGFSKYEIYPNEQRVWGYKRGKYLTPKKNKGGYLEYCLFGDDNKRHYITAHRLFWVVVNGEIPEGYEINHINEEKENNAISNLNLLTRKENNNWGTRNERADKSNSKPIIAKNDDGIKLFFPSMSYATKNGYNQGAICGCCRKTKGYLTYRGYEWQYLDDWLAEWWEQEMEKVA